MEKQLSPHKYCDGHERVMDKIQTETIDLKQMIALMEQNMEEMREDITWLKKVVRVTLPIITLIAGVLLRDLSINGDLTRSLVNILQAI